VAPIPPRLDIDAADERRPMLADLVEQEVLRGGKMSRARLATWVRKAGMLRQLYETYETVRAGGSAAEAEATDSIDDDRKDGAEPGPYDAANQAADRVFAQLEERARCLGDRYPFRLTESELLRAEGTSSEGYELLLMLSIAHRYAVKVEGVQLDRLFERLVAQCLPALGFRVKHFGTAATRSGSFKERVDTAAKDLGLCARWRSDRAQARRRANDAGVDVLGRLGAGDGRGGDWVLFAQTTVARSEDWDKKASEALHSSLRGVFEDHPRIAALAVPYHVATDRLLDLARNFEIVVFDRIRLALLLCVPLPTEHVALRAALTSVEFEWS